MCANMTRQRYAKRQISPNKMAKEKHLKQNKHENVFFRGRNEMVLIILMSGRLFGPATHFQNIDEFSLGKERTICNRRRSEILIPGI